MGNYVSTISNWVHAPYPDSTPPPSSPCITKSKAEQCLPDLVAETSNSSLPTIHEEEDHKDDEPDDNNMLGSLEEHFTS